MMLNSSKKKSIKSMLLNSVKEFLEFLIGRLNKMDKNTSTQTTTQPGLDLNIIDHTASQSSRSLTSEESIDATIKSYCNAYGITEQEVTMEEYKMLCNLISLYAHQPKQKPGC